MPMAGAPRGYPNGRGRVAYVGQVVPRMRTHDVYYECVGLREGGEPCAFWSYDKAKADTHVRKAGLHGIVEVEVDERAGLPEQTKIARREA